MFHNEHDKSSPLYSPPHTPSNQDHQELAALLASPPSVPNSPAPAYTALPHRDVDFHLAPLLHGQIGDIELETVDGKRFLVHKKLLDQETVFFHIYYGFIPVWRLNNTAVGPPHPHIPMPDQANTLPSAAGALDSLLGLPKLLASHLRSATMASSAPSSPSSPSRSTESVDRPPPLPPKDIVTAPTPTTNPYTWVVPETAQILTAFLALIYPRGTFTPAPNTLLASLEVTGRVIRASLGYQSAKALNAARDRMSDFIDTQPLETYAMASFFKFTDLAKLASMKALAIPAREWPLDVRNLMGKTAAKRLEMIQNTRLQGLQTILTKPPLADEHSEQCCRRDLMATVWAEKAASVLQSLSPDSELLELLAIDLRSEHCGDCLVLLGSTIQQSIYEARDLPRSI